MLWRLSAAGRLAYARRASMTPSWSGLGADFKVGTGGPLWQLWREQLTLVNPEKIVAPLLRGRSEHPRARKGAATDLPDPIVVAVKHGDGIRQRSLVIRVTGEAET